MAVRYGPVPEDRRPDWWAVQEIVFGFDMKDDERRLFAASTEWDRAIAGYTPDDAIVGTAGVFSFDMTVPGGGSLPTGGLTAVAVLPTHRRRGVLTGMMRSSFEDGRERGEPLCALLASESGIYGRFGYGVGTRAVDLEVSRVRAALRAGPHPAGATRMMATDEAREIIPDLHLRATSGMGIPGSVDRSPAMWDVYFHDAEHWRDGASGLRWAVYEDGGEPRGYVRYRIREKWEEAVPASTAVIADLQALDREAYASLVSFALGMDLMAAIRMPGRRTTEPLEELLADPRRVSRRERDGIWVRLLDVPAALAGRRYRIEGSLVIEVQDDFCPWNEGTYLLEAGSDGATCVPTDRPPDLRIGASDLASAYLGGSRLPAQAWAGRVGGTEEAVEKAHHMFSWGIEPWCSVFF